MNTIYKYEVPINDSVRVDLPHMAEVLCVQVQHGVPVIWCEVESDATISPRRFFWRGTGHSLDSLPWGCKYVGTVQLEGGSLVFHLYIE